MVDVESIANDAEVIICGFAFLKKDEFIKIVDLNNAHGVAVLKKDGSLIETNMDAIELNIARGYLSNALEYMNEAAYA
ncbi:MULTISPECIES: DUF7723 family protein [unclassified Fibrobacter]|jgi:hypothetical protein|uniref:DUF7723 family protein n=1 Tax=unclassified Fibrobacter TaxID=2634177 RepID=UPI0009215725|nr:MULTISPECIES: hypothetical protein [unclassified Fibrobacter]MBQ9225399.1 hypothetical protein [Fibrobacter sp.]MBR1746214.1 hypothetical protein [Fibrobacter sp.]SHG89299.1 hypothetical protein SAMN05720761_10660 [Fibrobacter sp. UWCM]